MFWGIVALKIIAVQWIGGTLKIPKDGLRWTVWKFFLSIFCLWMSCTGRNCTWGFLDSRDCHGCWICLIDFLGKGFLDHFKIELVLLSTCYIGLLKFWTCLWYLCFAGLIVNWLDYGILEFIVWCLAFKRGASCHRTKICFLCKLLFLFWSISTSKAEIMDCRNCLWPEFGVS